MPTIFQAAAKPEKSTVKQPAQIQHAWQRHHYVMLRYCNALSISCFLHQVSDKFIHNLQGLCLSIRKQDCRNDFSCLEVNNILVDV